MDEAEKSVTWNIRKQKTKKLIRATRRKKNFKKRRISSLWEIFKRSNIHIIGVPVREEKELEIVNLFEKKFKNLP